MMSDLSLETSIRFGPPNTVLMGCLKVLARARAKHKACVCVCVGVREKGLPAVKCCAEAACRNERLALAVGREGGKLEVKSGQSAERRERKVPGSAKKEEETWGCAATIRRAFRCKFGRM